MAKETDSTKEKGFEDVISASQPKFLEAVKETYYLAVLGSLCIAVSAFTQQTYPNAQVYAITGASLFLIAFVCSFVAKFLPSSFIIIPSYLSTSGGVLMLFLITVEFFNSITMVSKALTLTYLGLIFTIFLAIPFGLYQSRKQSRGKTKIILTLAIVSLLLMVMSLAVFLIPSIILNPITNPVLVAIVTISALIFLITGIGGIAFALIGISLLIIQKRSQRKEKKENKTFINEGSGV